MSTTNAPEGKSSGSTTEQPDDTIYVTLSASGSTQTYHLYPDCPRLSNSDVREKPFRHRPLSSSCCHYCQQRREEDQQ